MSGGTGVPVDVWLRGTNVATTETIDGVTRAPSDWTDDDVRLVLEGMLRAMSRANDPAGERGAVTLRGLSWIVNPFEDGGVVIAIEITLGAAIAGPFDLDRAALETMIRRVLAPAAPPSSPSVH